MLLLLLLLLLFADVGFGFGFGFRCCTFALRLVGEDKYYWFPMSASSRRDKYRPDVRDRANVEWHLLQILEKMKDRWLRLAKVQHRRSRIRLRLLFVEGRIRLRLLFVEGRIRLRLVFA